MNLQAAYQDIVNTFDSEYTETKEINPFYFKKYPSKEYPGKNPNRLISETYKIENDDKNYISIDYDCRDGI